MLQSLRLLLTVLWICRCSAWIVQPTVKMIRPPRSPLRVSSLSVEDPLSSSSSQQQQQQPPQSAEERAETERIDRRQIFSQQEDTRRDFFECIVAALLGGAVMGFADRALAATASADGGGGGGTKAIRPCPVGGGTKNCVSTASVRKLDLYASPWTWPETESLDEVLARLKGALAVDSKLSLQQEEKRPTGDSTTSYYFRVKAQRNFAEDELELLVNPVDRVVTFRSQQVEGPEVGDLGANRKRLEEIRQRAKLSIQGAEFNSADAGPREGVGGQLRAFWGLQSGGGYEDVLLDEE